jgi:hypothetical protein
VIKPQIDMPSTPRRRRDGDRALLRRPARADGRAVPALQNGTIDAVQSDDATMASPVDIAVFGGYFPFATRYSLDVPVLFNQYGLNEIWAEAYGEGRQVTWLGRRLGPLPSSPASRSAASPT